MKKPRPLSVAGGRGRGSGVNGKNSGASLPANQSFSNKWMSFSTVRSPQTHEPPPRKEAAPRCCAACPVDRVRETGAGLQSKPEGAGLWQLARL